MSKLKEAPASLNLKFINHLINVIKRNHEHHIMYDDYDGYPESGMCEMNEKALASLRYLSNIDNKEKTK